MRRLLCSLPLLLAACSSEGTTDPAPANPGTPAAESAEAEESGAEAQDPVEALREHVAAFAARDEHTDPAVKVQHILIAFAGASRSTTTRTKEEAEALAADLWQQLEAGGDIDALMAANSDDPGPGIYTMTLGASSTPQAYPRGQMAPAFGDSGWRLQVGEIGVAAYDPTKSPFGWHIIKRLP